MSHIQMLLERVQIGRRESVIRFSGTASGRNTSFFTTISHTLAGRESDSSIHAGTAKIEGTWHDWGVEFVASVFLNHFGFVSCSPLICQRYDVM